MYTKLRKNLRDSHRLGMRLAVLMALVAAIFSSVVPVSAAPLAAPRITTVGVGSQTGSLTGGTAGSVSYVISVTKANSGNNNNNVTATLSVTGGLPAGATASFSPATLNWTSTQTGVKTTTLTINTTATTPGGVSNFTVRARIGNTSDSATGNGTLTINIVQVAPTITFTAPPTPVYLGGNFIVTANTNSNGARTYSAVSGPCAVVDAALGIFSSSGAGVCVVQASTAATSSYLAGSAQQSVTIAPATPIIIWSGDPYQFMGDNFTTVATTNSGAPATYSVVSGNCSVVDANLGIFNPTATGPCVLQVDTPATANFTAGSSQKSVTILVPGFDLHAVAGTTTLPDGASVAIWGYTSDGSAATKPGGPTLIVNQGDLVAIKLHNTLAEATSLLIQGQIMVPDRTGAASNGTKNYVFTADHAGTYLYEAGLLANGQHQVAMGLYGVLIVRPATAGQAYDSAATAYNDEAVVLLSELDPALSANPAGFDLRKFNPKYWLINGQAYSNTTPSILPGNTLAGSKVLLRFVNAGLQTHSMATLGLKQSVIAQDGSQLAYSHRVVAETIAPGQTADAIVTIPAAAPAGSKFAVYDGNLLLRNNTKSGFGGMLTFLSIADGTTGSDTTGPATIAPTITPDKTNGSVDVTLQASVSDAASGNGTIAAAEYFIDTVGPDGSGFAMVATDAAFDSVSEGVSATILAANIATLTSGSHIFYIHGQDSAGNWGTTNIATLNLDKIGPATTGFLLSPNPSNGSTDVTLSATADDSASGNSNIAAAEFTLDGGAAQPMIVNNTNSSIAGLSATIPAATLTSIVEGQHAIVIRSRDSYGNWGATTQRNLLVDRSAPTTNNVSASPNPNNGTTGLSATQPVVRVSATFDDVSVGSAAGAFEAAPDNADLGTNHVYLPVIVGGQSSTENADVEAAAIQPDTSYVKAAEGFIDTIGANGTGFPFAASDGLFDSLHEVGFADIPLATIGQLSTGAHTIYVHSQDGVGNWGTTASVVLTIDKLAPSASNVVLTPNATNNTPVVVSASATDVLSGNSNIAVGEYFIDVNNAAAGTGSLMTAGVIAPATTINATIPATALTALTEGNHTVYVRAQDVAGNWSALTSGTLRIDRTAPTFSGITLSPNSIAVGTASVNLTVSGANDGANGSGVVGGEYWFGTSNITAGTGTAFAGTSATIATNSLTAGTYTVRVRIRDAAGNWSTGNNGVRTATLTVTAVIADAIFADGFESGTLNPLTGWSSRSTNTTSRLTATSTGALVGSYSLIAQGNNTNYVQFDFGNANSPATNTLDARFYFNPNSNTGNNQDIFVARTGSNNNAATLFRVRYRWNGGTPQVQIQVGGNTNNNNPWTNITNGVSNRIEVVWQASGTLQLYVGAATTASQSLTFNATNNTVASFRLGSVISGGNNATQAEYFDAFSAKRSVTPLYGQ